MKLQAKIWLGTGVVVAALMSVDAHLGFQRIESDLRAQLQEEAHIVRAILMATRRVYHEQFIASEIPLTEKTVGFLPAHALSRISADFPHWFDSGLRFNNVSDKTRNPVNQADANELAAMDWFRANREAKERTTTIRDPDGSEYLHFTTPIWIEPYCLKCHGSRDQAPVTIRDTYAGAYGYQMGDLRGVMSIKLPVNEVRKRTVATFQQHFAARAVGYLVMLGLLGLMLQFLVTRRLAKLESAAKLMTQGKLDVRVELPGKDEVASLGNAFNSLAAALHLRSQELDRQQQIYAALSETNQTIVRVKDETELLDRVTRIAVELGGMSLAWIGRCNPVTYRAEILAAFGTGAEQVRHLDISLAPGAPTANGVIGRTWHSGTATIIQDYFADAATVSLRPTARQYDMASAAAFPIRRDGRLALIMVLTHAEKQAFNPRIVDLLTEMAIDIGYALDRIDLEFERLRMDVAIRESEERYRSAILTSRDGFLQTDTAGRLIDVNDAYLAFSGYSRAELLSMNIHELEGSESAADVIEHTQHMIANGGALFESVHRTRSGELKPVEVSVTYMAELGQFAAFIRDLSAREAAKAHIQQLSNFDSLTGLPNRALFTDRFGQALGRAQRNHETLSLVFLDLDHFKNINDSLGHRIGDLLLLEVTQRLLNSLRAEDTVSRLGGDEFILLLPKTDPERVAHVAEKLLQTIVRPMQIEDRELVVTASLGIALYPADGRDFETLFRKADTAANSAKQAGRHVYRFFTPEMQTRSSRLLELETALRKAIERNELTLYYQPQVSLTDGAVVGVEALLRWMHPQHGMISPAEFIPVAESSGLILPIGEWVLRQALRQMREWVDSGVAIPVVAVNLSAVQFRQPALPDLVGELVAQARVDSARLEIELTESATVENPEQAVEMVNALHAQGIKLSVDDFGTGYSSLSYLKRFRIDKLKIDQSFVRDLKPEGQQGDAIVNAVVGMAASLRFSTIAEGVETEFQLDYLRQCGCHEAQGYLLSRPLPVAELMVWLEAWKTNPLRQRCGAAK